MRIPLRWLSPAAVVLCELLGILSIALTPEAGKEFLYGLLLALPLLLIVGLRLGNRLLLFLVAGTVAGGIAMAWLRPGYITPTLLSSILLVHGMLRLASDTGAYRYWRLGIGFLEIVLSSILSPETHMFLIIFAFMMMASLALSFGFLERNFEQRRPEALGRPVRPGFLLAVISASFLIFLSSLIIFPILPRSNWSGFGGNLTEAGYSEVVSVQGRALRWAGGTPRPLLWIFRPSGLSWGLAVPNGLVRGKVLDVFDGREWRSGSKQFSQEFQVPGEKRLEIYREPLPTDILPVPYGVSGVEMDGSARKPYLSGEWAASSFRNRRVKYQAGISGSREYPRDPPKKIHSVPPSRSRFPDLMKLAAKLKKGTSTDEDRIRNLLDHFTGFEAALVPLDGDRPGGRHPLETFLFETKKGHCELFAASAALLFRAMGMPARLVAGFRSSLPRGSVLTVNSTDAHAWVEVWVEGRGWLPLDPTPVVASPAGWLDPLRESYDWVNAYWHRFILGYEFDFRGWVLLMRNLPRMPLVLLAALLAVIFMAARLKIPGREEWTGREDLSRVWRKLEEKAAGLGDEKAFLASGRWQEIRATYLAYRFGRRPPTVEEIRELGRKGREAIRAYVPTAGAGSGPETRP